MNRTWCSSNYIPSSCLNDTGMCTEHERKEGTEGLRFPSWTDIPPFLSASLYTRDESWANAADGQKTDPSSRSHIRLIIISSAVSFFPRLPSSGPILRIHQSRNISIEDRSAQQYDYPAFWDTFFFTFSLISWKKIFPFSRACYLLLILVFSLGI